MGKVPLDPTVRTPPFAHSAIILNHGKNDRCYNCHLINDRNKYVNNDGSGIMPQTFEKVYARCDGLIYKDWQNNTMVFGEVNGWLKTLHPMCKHFQLFQITRVCRSD